MKKAFFLALLIGAAVFAFAQNGIIRELAGEVSLKPAGASAFVPAAAGASVALDTIVSTGFKSTAIIAAGSSVITVRPLTRLTLAEIQTASGTESVNVNLQAGRVKVDVKPPAGTRTNFTVQSPSATASVRGTSFDFDTVSLKTFEGKVAFGGKFGVPLMVYAGDMSVIGKDGKAIDPGTVGSGKLQPPPVSEQGFVGIIDRKISNIDIEIGYE
jgi:hypothetical protein